MNSEVPQNLTFEEFQALANREPSMEGNWLYRLTHETINDDYSYPEFGIYDFKYMFLSFVEAEKYMREKLVPYNEHYENYRFLIEQAPIGKHENETGVTWVYDKNGELVETATTCSEPDHYLDSVFFGRRKERIRFHEGDIVEVVDGDTVHLAIVGAEPPSVEWFWGLYCRSKEYGYNTDCGDDNYYVVDGPGDHDHPHATMVMKPSLPIPQDIKEYFEEYLAMSKRQDIKYGTLFNWMHRENMFDAVESKIILRYDLLTERHRLILRTFNDITGTKSERVLPGDFKEKELHDISEWLNFKKYGKSRLWYLIMGWNDAFGDVEDPLCTILLPDIPLEKLLKQ